MWKLSYIILSLITIGNSSAHDRTGTTEISRNFHNYENQDYHEEAKSHEYTNEKNDRRYNEKLSRGDLDEFEGDKLIGKWRNSGSALEPKWRDGDSLPLVPFNNVAKRKSFVDHGIINEDVKSLESSRVVTKFNNRAKEQSSRDHQNDEDDETIEKIPISFDYRRTTSDETNDRYSLEENYEKFYNPHDDSAPDNDYEKREKTRNSETIETVKNSKDPTLRLEKKIKELSYSIDNDEESSRSRYRDTFQSPPNEYELNDDEYQKPRPRKRRPPQNYEFLETRAPTYSITWSTERYIESAGNFDKETTRMMKKPEVTTRRRGDEKKLMKNRERPSSTVTRKVSENSELKSLLKMQQIEGLSLSELLQRRNLTLDDLLKGKAEVLNVLKSRNDDSTEIIDVRSKIFETKKSHDSAESAKPEGGRLRDKNSNATFNEISKISKNDNNMGIDGEREKVDDMEIIDSLESEDRQRRINDNEKLSAIVRLTKPIILPGLNFFNDKSTRITTIKDDVRDDSIESHQSDDITRKDETVKIDDDEIMEFSDFSMKKIESTTGILDETTGNEFYVKHDDDTGSTLSIENILSPTQQTATILPINEKKLYDTKVNSVTTDKNNSDHDILRIFDSDYQSDEPREINEDEVLVTNDKNVNNDELTMNDQPYDGTTMKIDEITNVETDDLPKNHQIFSTSGKPYDLVISEIEPEARAEIFELFSSGSSAKRLERLLKSRNMSIDELISLRQRGSSKVHLAEVLRTRDNVDSRNYNKNDETSSKSSWNESTTTSTEINLPETTNNDLSYIELDSTTLDSEESDKIDEQTNISSIGRDKGNIHVATTMKNEKNEELLELLRAFDSLPFSIRTESFVTEESTNDERTTIKNENIVENTKVSDLPMNHVEIGLVEEIIEESLRPNDDLIETTERTNYSIITKSIEERKNLSKVRPSIIASGAILGFTIVVFLAIFIVCRIRQKQKYTYRNTFSRAVFQGPAMTARKLSNSSSLNTIMVNVVATSTTKRPDRRDNYDIDENFEPKSDIENDSLDANDSWETIPDFMK